MSWELYYWRVPFRSAAIRLLFVQAGEELSLADSSDVSALKNLSIHQQPVPAMAPPILLSEKEGVALSQMPAICLFISQRFDLIDNTPLACSQLVKVLGDMNDILCEITRNNGHQLWERAAWEEFLDARLPRWADITMRNAELYSQARSSSQLNAIDLVQWAIWGTFRQAFPELEPWFQQRASGLDEYLTQMAQYPRLETFFEEQKLLYDGRYCGGKIENSIREMLQSSA
ncbi:MAG: hypothetical protein MK135_01300 [Polyangiaceae bacterium]|nr:hypothetical protein [Polyangiaceae bacterium]